MSELTPERIRDAAEVVRILRPNFTGIQWVLEDEADLLERKREKRVQALAREIYETDSRNKGYPYDNYPAVHPVMAGIARGLLDRYPSLAEADA